jgi:hypothetical protein
VAPSGPPLGAAWRFGFPALLVICGYGLTFLDMAMQVIELTPTTATFIGRHGFVFHHAVVFKRRPDLHFTGKTESGWTMHTHQRLPNFVLTGTAGWFQKKRVMSMCTPAQGAWIRDALGHWASGSPQER